MASFLRDVVTDTCAFSSKKETVFRNTFEKAHDGVVNNVQNVAQTMAVGQTLDNDFKR